MISERAKASLALRWRKDTRIGQEFCKASGLLREEMPAEVVEVEENDEVDPQAVEEVPIDGEQAKFEAFFGVGEVDEYADRLFHALARYEMEGDEEGEAADYVQHVNGRDEVEVGG